LGTLQTLSAVLLGTLQTLSAVLLGTLQTLSAVSRAGGVRSPRSVR
jgi:hypothetical protein